MSYQHIGANGFDPLVSSWRQPGDSILQQPDAMQLQVPCCYLGSLLGNSRRSAYSDSGATTLDGAGSMSA
jgi:hypothetical protein